MKKKLYPWHTWQFIALPIFVLVMLCVLVFGIINQPIVDSNDIIRIDPNSDLVRNLNLLYDPNFYSTGKIVGLQIDCSNVNSVGEAVSTLKNHNYSAKEVIDIEVIIGNETRTATFEDFFEWMGFER